MDRPVWEQYVAYVWRAAHGDFGRSFYYRDRPVASIIADGLPVSATLGALAIGIAVVLALPLGILAALRQNSLLDYLSMSFAVAGVSVPIFVLAPLLIWVLALSLDLLPVAGWGTFQQALIPAIALGVRPAAVLARQVRQSVIEVLGQDYVRTARAKGLSEGRTVFAHVLRNALLPVTTVLGVLIAGLITGTFIIETISSVPGIGNIAVTSVFRRDYPVLMAISLIYSVAYVVMNLMVDVLYAVIDPRIRY
jgi:oligopeptide transport system permease protein